MTNILTGLFDVSTSTAQGWAQESYRRAVADSRWMTENLALGTTVANQSDYPLPANVVVLRSLAVAGVQYERIGEFDLVDIKAGTAVLSSSGGVFAQSSSSAGADQVTLHPAPTQSGLAITAKAELVPTDLVTGTGAGSSPIFPADLHPVVVDGAISIGYLRTDERPDMAMVHESRYQEGVQRLRARKIARVSGRAPTRIMVSGRDF
jgi:hypothetical protein